ncbi:MAG TPA: hypothetical protein VGR31_08120 [Planctomycetota bacterium]|jgi:hypothetical protein|nr:hypothetical protein [Planctomycetota bacterium]
MSKDTHSTPPTDPKATARAHHEDDVVVVPKGSSKARFLMTALLAILVLTTFTVSREVVDIFTGGNKAKTAYMSWKRPDGTIEEIKDRDFLIVKQDLSRVQSILTGGRSSQDHDDTQTARHIILDELAKEAGVEVTDAEIRDVILPRVGNSKDNYELMLDRYRMTAIEFEGTLRAMLRTERYLSLLSGAYAAPDADEVVEQWKQQHKEYSIETIAIETADFEREASEACPTGDDLKAWFDALPEPEKNSMRPQTQPTVSAEVAWYVIDPPTKSERLLKKYPRPADEKPEEVARNWYEANKTLLYRKPDLPAGKAPSPEDFLPFEEVQDKALALGLVYQCTLDWVNDMKARELRGEAFNFLDDVTALGFGYRNEMKQHTRAEWNTLGIPWAGMGVIDALFAQTSESGKAMPDVVVDTKGIFVAHIINKEAGHNPDFSEIQEKAHDAWVAKKKGELALAKLETLRAKLPTQPDERDPATPMVVEPDNAKFQGAAQESGFTITPHDWFDAGARLTVATATIEVSYLRQIAGRLGTVPGAVSKPELTPDKKEARMARVVGSREADPARMTPLEYQNARQSAGYTASRKFNESTFGSDEYLKERFALDLQAWRREDADKSSKQSK